MNNSTQPPDGYQTLTLQDRAAIEALLASDPPETSELTFTNLFMWRHHYQPCFRIKDDVGLFICRTDDGVPFGLPPTGGGDKATALERLFKDLEGLTDNPRVSRVGRAFVDSHLDQSAYLTEPDENQFDYVYLCEDLIKLGGRKLHQKKNHLNQFVKNNEFETRLLDSDLAGQALELQESWCQMRQCHLDPSLSGEDRAVYEALTHFSEMGYKGLAVIINGQVEAFALGEPLNPETVVIHVEKANPEIRGLYAAVNQRFCLEVWSEYPYINREQDLGVEGLRRAKQSYHPHHMVEKFNLTRR
jgi:hypothetical protein